MTSSYHDITCESIPGSPAPFLFFGGARGEPGNEARDHGCDISVNIHFMSFLWYAIARSAMLAQTPISSILHLSFSFSPPFSASPFLCYSSPLTLFYFVPLLHFLTGFLHLYLYICTLIPPPSFFLPCSTLPPTVSREKCARLATRLLRVI